MDAKVISLLNEILEEVRTLKQKVYDLEKPSRIEQDILSVLHNIERNTDR